MEGTRIVDNEFSWVIKDFSNVGSEIIYSDEYQIGGCKWRLMAYPKGDRFKNYLSLYLELVDSLTYGWTRRARFNLSVVNQRSGGCSKKRDKDHRFDQNKSAAGFMKMIHHSELFGRKGLMVDGNVMICVKIHVRKVNVEVSDEESEEGSESDSEEASCPLKKTKLNDDRNKSNDSHNKTLQVNVNGFQVLPSQAESVKCIFEKHPNMALNFRAKNQRLRTSCMNTVLDMIDTLCQSLQDLSMDDLGTADSALTYLKSLGFEVDWLERKLEERKEKKVEEEIGEIRIQDLEEELKSFKQKYSDIEVLLEKKKEELKDLNKKCLDTEALLNKEKAKLSAARVHPLTWDDVV